MMNKFEIYEDKAGDYRFRLRASNGQTVLSSEGYTSKSAAKNGIESVWENAHDADRFENSSTSEGTHRFSLKAKNKQIIGQSQNYKSKSARDNGVEAVRSAAAGAEVEDLTE